MKSTWTFIQKNWLLIGLIVLVLWVWKSKTTDFRGYKAEIELLSDSIVQLDSEYLLMEERVSALQELAETAIDESTLYRDSLNNAKNRIRTNTTRHAKEVAGLKRIPTDTLYVDVTTWLDSLSAVW